MRFCNFRWVVLWNQIAAAVHVPCFQNYLISSCPSKYDLRLLLVFLLDTYLDWRLHADRRWCCLWCYATEKSMWFGSEKQHVGRCSSWISSKYFHQQKIHFSCSCLQLPSSQIGSPTYFQEQVTVMLLGICLLLQIFGPNLGSQIWHLPSFVNGALIFDSATQETFLTFKLKTKSHKVWHHDADAKKNCTHSAKMCFLWWSLTDW